MLLKEILGIQVIEKEDKVWHILHTATAEPVTGRDKFVGRQCENIFVGDPSLLPDGIKVGSKIRVYYDNVGGKAYLCGIELCK